jgi:hypothetical protein
MTQAAYTVSDSPADVEAAALDLIVRLPGHIMHTDALTEVLQDYCGVLHAEGEPARRASEMQLPVSPPLLQYAIEAPQRNPRSRTGRRSNQCRVISIAHLLRRNGPATGRS